MAKITRKWQIDSPTQPGEFGPQQILGSPAPQLLASHGGTGAVVATLLTDTPDDPLFAQQWHFNQLGDIQAVWEDFDGTGVRVGIYDEGVQYSHTDLDGNYDASLHVTVDSVTYDGANVGNAGHGTSVAGLIAAEGNNAEGGIGVANGATIAGVNIFDSSSHLYINAGDFSGFIGALEQCGNFDVVNNSWGSTPSFGTSQNVNVANSFDAQAIEAWKGVVENGRDGLGVIVVKSSGNDARNSNGEGLNSTRYTITVGAARDNGFASSYSNHGADLLVSASAGDLASQGGLGIVTADLLGTQGYNLRSNSGASSDYTDDFGGTSAAAPIVTGVVALMLDANAGLGWRDVQEILSMGARHTGSTIGATAAGAYENGIWFFNGGSDWNGGARHFSVNYGYGLVDAYNSVRIAEAYKLFAPDAATSANEATMSISNSVGGAITDANETFFDISGATSFDIEHITVTVTLTHAFFTDLRIYLVAPDGTEVMLADGTAGSSATSDSPLTWSFGVDSFRGMDAAGDWKLRVGDVFYPDAGSISGIQLDFFGTASSANDVYHFTNEFSDMVALDDTRSRISDTDGGTDWLDLAAVTSATILNLTKKNGTIDGVAVKASGLENVVSGDGDDTLTGNKAANELAGGRGMDMLRGGKGNDEFRYMSVRDSLSGDSQDIIYDFGSGKDKIDLQLIDAIKSTDIDDGFTFIGKSSFGSVAGELRYQIFDLAGTKKDVTIIEADVTGDGVADFAVELAGLHALKFASFML